MLPRMSSIEVEIDCMHTQDETLTKKTRTISTLLTQGIRGITLLSKEDT